MLRILVLGIGGLMISALGVVAYVGLSPTKQAAAAPTPMVSVLAASHALRAGSLLQPGDIAEHEVPANRIPNGARTDTAAARNAIVGAMVRRTLGDHEVIGIDDVLRPGDRGFLAAVLQPGTRAVSVAVDAVSGEAGLIWPGDRVDVILTQEIEGTDQSPGHRVAGETVLGDVRVIAVDQELVQGGQASGLLEGRSAGSRTITLEVTPRDAARIAVATRLGKLQVVLRAAPSPAPSSLPAVAASGAASGSGPQPIATAVSVPASLTPASRAAASPDLVSAAGAPMNSAAMASGPVWGGDVSRALGTNSAAANTEVRLFRGTKDVEAYKF